MLGLVNVFMVRVNLSVAIVAMVYRNTTTTTTTTLLAHCQALNATPGKVRLGGGQVGGESMDGRIE